MGCIFFADAVATHIMLFYLFSMNFGTVVHQTQKQKQ